MKSLMMTSEFQHILRILNTNVEGKLKVWLALTAIKGVGRNLAMLVCRKADVDINKRAGQLTPEEVEKLVAIVSAPTNFKIPNWYLNRQRDYKDGKSKHLVSNQLDTVFREDIERLKKIRCNRGLRHYWGYRVRGQHTKTTGRYGLLAHSGSKKK